MSGLRVITVWSGGASDLEGSLIEAIEFLNARLNMVPAQFMEDAELVMDTYEGCALTIRYCRPETEEDLAKDASHREAAIADYRAKEIERLKELAQKYGVKLG